MGKRNRRKGRRKKLKTSVQVAPRAVRGSRAPECEAARYARGTEPPRDDAAAREPSLGLATAVTLDSQSNFYTGFADDISEGGVFVATDRLYPIGTALRLRFSLPDERGSIEVEGEVRWVRQLISPSEYESGIGVAFGELPASARARIESFLAERDALFYD